MIYILFFAVIALQAIKKQLIDPKNYLKNWNKRDPCTSNWTGVICSDKNTTDEYLHVTVLYVPFFTMFDLFILFSHHFIILESS